MNMLSTSRSGEAKSLDALAQGLKGEIYWYGGTKGLNAAYKEALLKFCCQILLTTHKLFSMQLTKLTNVHCRFRILKKNRLSVIKVDILDKIVR